MTSYPELVELARQTSQSSFTPSDPLPEAWASLNYDEYRKVVFDPNKAFWRSEKLPFFLEAFHRGFVHRDQVNLYSTSAGSLEAIPFSSNLFDYRGKISGESLSPDFGFAGYRIVGKFPDRQDWQELLTFLGASYFRGRNALGVYGSSARGLAIDAGLSKPEEFPVYRAHWIEKPESNATSIRILALMDSPSVVGAYAFRLTPGVKRSTLDVESTLYFRTIPEKIGIAPLTSMWMWGDGLAGPKDDERPEVHDADTLLICSHEADGTQRWLSRALMRQNYPSLVRFPQTALRGFGLLQRDVDPTHFQDSEAKYHLRPSLWVEPTTNWGEGAIELLELPAEHEGIDNIAAWWVASSRPTVGEPMRYGYRIHFDVGDPLESRLAKAIAYRVERPKSSGQTFRIGIDFASSSGSLGLEVDSELVAQCSTVRCVVEKSSVVLNPDGTCSVELWIRPNTPHDPFELLLDVRSGDRRLTETWSYLCPQLAPPVALPPWRHKP